MAHIPDNVETYKVCDEVRTFEVPAGSTSVTFVATTPIWAAGGVDVNTLVKPFVQGNVYIPANIVMTIKFDQSLAPWVGVLGHVGGVQGFITAIWHNDAHEEEAVVKAIAFFDSQV